MSKHELRRRMQSGRLSLKEGYIESASRRIVANLFSEVPLEGYSKILAYIPIKNEVDTTGLIDQLVKDGKEVFLPAFFNKKWVVCRFESSADMEKVYGDVLQPKIVSIIDPGVLDAAIVPGVAFTNSGGRLGFGLGVYDRLLSVSRATRIGLCYDFQIVDGFDTSGHDVRMDFVITESTVYKAT